MDGVATMKRVTVLIVSLAVILILVLVYWSSVGFRAALPDFDGSPEPDSETTKAYATFSIKGTTWLKDEYTMTGLVSSIAPTE